MDTQVVQVRALKSDSVMLETAHRGYMSGLDPITGKPYVWYPGEPQEVVIPLSVLPTLEADPRLEVRRVDPRAQAAKRMELALAADKEATAAEAHAKQLREKADFLFEEAQRSLDAAGSTPIPEVKRETPGTDQMLAALPDSVRKALDKLTPEQVVKELLKPASQRLAEQVLVSTEGVYDKAVAQAFPNNKAAQDEALANSPIGGKKSKK